MSLQSRLATLITAIGTDIKQQRVWISGSSTGDLTGLTTTDKTSLVNAINELKTNILVVPVALWIANTSFVARQLVYLSTGGTAYKTAAYTSRASFDATERFAWIFFPGGHYESATATGTWTCPNGITKLKIRLIGGGAGAGGSGSASGSFAGQCGGSGGGAASITEVEVSVSPGTTYSFTIGAAGTSGSSGASGGNNGGNGGDGGDSSIVVAGVTFLAKGGGKGLGSTANSAAAVNGGVCGMPGRSSLTSWQAGNGGPASTTVGIGAVPLEYVCGGGAGAPATATLGGNGGNARTASGALVDQISTNTATAAGAAGTTATQRGSGGGGGGAGATGGAGGAGGAGCAGSIEFWF